MKPIARSARYQPVRRALRRQQDRQPDLRLARPELDGLVDTSMLDTLFDAETLAEIVEESEEEVQSLKAALGG
jgi:phage terminase large subunit-like protein